MRILLDYLRESAPTCASLLLVSIRSSFLRFLRSFAAIPSWGFGRAVCVFEVNF